MVGTTGASAGVVPAVMTSGLYTCSVPFGDRMVASTNAPSVPVVASEQPSPSCHGVARPLALSGLAGTVMVQFIDAAACAAVWFRLIAAPVPSTGLVARSPSWRNAVWPLAKLGAAGTTAAGRRAGARASRRAGRGRGARPRRAAGRRGAAGHRRARGRRAARARRRLVDGCNGTSRDREDDPEGQPQRHRYGEGDRNARRTTFPTATAPCGPMPAEHSIHLHGCPL